MYQECLCLVYCPGTLGPPGLSSGIAEFVSQGRFVRESCPDQRSICTMSCPDRGTSLGQIDLWKRARKILFGVLVEGSHPQKRQGGKQSQIPAVSSSFLGFPASYPAYMLGHPRTDAPVSVNDLLSSSLCPSSWNLFPTQTPETGLARSSFWIGARQSLSGGRPRTMQVPEL